MCITDVNNWDIVLTIKYVTCVGTSTIITDICVGILTDFLGCFVFCHYTPVTWTDDELHQLQCEIKKKKKVLWICYI